MRCVESETEYIPDTELAIETVAETVEAKTEVFRVLDEQLEVRQHSSSRVRFVDYRTRVKNTFRTNEAEWVGEKGKDSGT